MDLTAEQNLGAASVVPYFYQKLSALYTNQVFQPNLKFTSTQYQINEEYSILVVSEVCPEDSDERNRSD